MSGVVGAPCLTFVVRPSMRAFLNRIFKRQPENPWGESHPVALIRAGWTPHSFPNSTVIVILPPGMTVSFDQEGVLYGFAGGPDPVFTATLQTNDEFKQHRELALEFVGDLAEKKGARPIDFATYRYFIDPTEEREGERVITFFVIGIPGAVVVVSLSRQHDSPPLAHVESIRHAIPKLIGEMA
jgi:hypothetical protein